MVNQLNLYLTSLHFIVLWVLEILEVCLYHTITQPSQSWSMYHDDQLIKKKNHTYWCQEWWLVLVTLFHPYKAQVHTFQIQKKFKSLGFFFFFFCEISFLPTNLELLFFSLVFHFPFSPSLLKTWDTWLGDHFLLTTLCRTQDFLFNPSSKKNSRHRLSISMCETKWMVWYTYSLDLKKKKQIGPVP